MRLGEKVLLVYRECPCGQWCATGEGSLAPRCHLCGGCFLPGGVVMGQERRREVVRGFLAEFGMEQELLERGEHEPIRTTMHAVYDPQALRDASLKIMREESRS